MSEILRPQTLLLDTGHLVNLVHRTTGQGMRRGIPTAWGDAYDELDRRLRSGDFIALFYEPLSYEWIQVNSIERALEIAAVLDRAMCVRNLLPDPVLFQVEAMNAAKIVEPGLDYPGFDVIRDLGFDAEIVEWFTRVWPDTSEHPTTVPVVVPGDVTEPSVSAIVRGLQPVIDGGRDLWKEALEGSRVALAQTRDTQRRLGRKGPCPESFKRHWLRTALGLDEILLRSGPGFDPKEIIAHIDLSACPAIDLKVDAYWQYARANEEAQENDTIDLTLLAPIPYAAYALIEKRLAEFVRQAGQGGLGERVFKDPVELIRAAS